MPQMSGKANALPRRQILVIGGAGYIGSVLVRKLLARGYQVRVVDKLIYHNGGSVAGLGENPDFTFIKGDFCDDRLLASALEEVTDVVLLAAIVGDPVCKKNPEVARKTNEAGSIQLFNRLAGQGVEHFIFTSTCSNYGLRETDELATEAAALNPKSLYAETKVNVEKHILANRGKVDFCPTILRISTAYGISYRMRFDLTIAEFSRELALGRNLLVYDENTWRPYCHIGDISEAVIKVLEAPREKVSGEIFNVGSNDGNFTKKMIVETILKYLPAAEVNYQQGGYDPRNYRVSFDKIAARLDFKTAFTIPGSVANLIKAIQNGMFEDVEARGDFYRNY
jgi:nucleoside-diphosphate-sugar epimerase